MRRLIVRLTGKACPCDRGLVCPLLPQTQAQIRAEEERERWRLVLPPPRALMSVPGLLVAIEVARAVAQVAA